MKGRGEQAEVLYQQLDILVLCKRNQRPKLGGLFSCLSPSNFEGQAMTDGGL